MLLICDFQFKKTLNYFDGILRKMARTIFMITEQTNFHGPLLCSGFENMFSTSLVNNSRSLRKASYD